jgi:signal peptidase I
MKTFLKIILFIILLFLVVGFLIYIFKIQIGFDGGASMEPTLSENSVSIGSSKLNPNIGDIISFNCISSKCKNGDEYIMLKRIISIDTAGCYWVEGDNKEISFDSTEYGWVCPKTDIAYVRKVFFTFNYSGQMFKFLFT